MRKKLCSILGAYLPPPVPTSAVRPAPSSSTYASPVKSIPLRKSRSIAPTLKSQPVPSQLLRCVLRYLSLRLGAKPPRPGGSSREISVLNDPVKRSGSAASELVGAASTWDLERDDRFTTASAEIGVSPCAKLGVASARQ